MKKGMVNITINISKEVYWLPEIAFNIIKPYFYHNVDTRTVMH